MQHRVEHVAVYVHPLKVADRLGQRRCGRMHGRTHILNSFSTSSGVTRPWTKMSGGLTLSIIVARNPRLKAGPGSKNVSHATPCARA